MFTSALLVIVTNGQNPKMSITGEFRIIYTLENSSIWNTMECYLAKKGVKYLSICHNMDRSQKYYVN